MLALSEEDGAQDDRGERGDPHRAEPAAGERLAEDRHAGDDRERVGEQRRDPRRGQGTATLEAGLEDERPERIGGDQGGDEGEVAVSRLDGALRRDVAGGKQETGCDAVRGRGADAAAEQPDQTSAAPADAAIHRATVR